MFGKNLKKTMELKGFTVTSLSQATGIGKSSISQYLSGKNVPTNERIKEIASALNVEPDVLIQVPTVEKNDSGNTAFNVPVDVVAKLMCKSNDFVYAGLQQGIFPFGWGVKMSSVWTYYISSTKFTECTGIPVSRG